MKPERSKEGSMNQIAAHEKFQLPDFNKYLFPADITLIRCVDERQAEETDNTNGVEIPGAVYGIIDAIKHFKTCSEDEAWKLAMTANIPLGGHTDEHHGALGCGYARIVENTPDAVLAPEKVPAADRLKKIQQVDGLVLNLLGEHHPTHAVINYKEGYSLDPDQAAADGWGIFNFDKWAARAFGTMLQIDGEIFADHLENVYKRTVQKLTQIQSFHELR